MDCKLLLCFAVFTAFVAQVTPCLDCDCLQVQPQPYRIAPLRKTIQATIPPFTSYLRWLRGQRNKFFREINRYEDNLEDKAINTASSVTNGLIGSVSGAVKTVTSNKPGCPYSYETPKTCNCVVRLPPIQIPQLPRLNLPTPCCCQSNSQPNQKCNKVKKIIDSDEDSDEDDDDNSGDMICAECAACKTKCAACLKAQENDNSNDDDSDDDSSSSSSSEEHKDSVAKHSDDDKSDDTNEDDDIIGGDDDDSDNDSAPSKAYCKKCKAQIKKLRKICKKCGYNNQDK